jgi:4-amino-4-deoxy-L-arabinose transferase-like glycosyltransferase
MLGATCLISRGATPQVVGGVWLAGAVWLVVAASLKIPSPGPRLRAGASVWFWGMLIVALSAVARFWHIDNLPLAVHHDEAIPHLIGRQFFADPHRDYFSPPVGAGAWSSVMNLAYALSGLGPLLFGFNLAAARAASAAMGTLSVVLLFVGVRRVANLRVAIAAAVLLAANHAHLAFSRLASLNIQASLVATAVFALFTRLITRPTYLDAALLGILMAFGMQTYFSSQIVPPLLLVVVVSLIASRSRFRPPAAALVILAITCCTAIGPFALRVWRNPSALTARAHDINIFSPSVMAGLKRYTFHTDSTAAVVARSIWRGLCVFHTGHDDESLYHIDRPLADRYTAAWMIPGAVLIVRHASSFLALNTLVFTFGSLLMLGLQANIGFNRVMGGVPFAMILAAVTIVQCSSMVWRGRRISALRDVMIAALLLPCVCANLWLYFGSYARARVTIAGEPDSEAAAFARAYAARYRVYMASWPRDPNFAMQLALAGSTAVVSDEPHDAVAYVREAPCEGATLFIIDARDTAALDAARSRFPQARVNTYRRRPNGTPVLFLVFVGEPPPPPSSSEARSAGE